MLFIQNKRPFKSVALGLILLFSSHITYAQWTGIASSSDRGGYVVYLDPSSSTAFEGISNIWLLYDFKVIQQVKTSPYLSYKIQIEIDCRNNIGRILGFMDFSEPMGKGVPVRRDYSAQNWTPLIPGGKDKILWDVACLSFRVT
jgi:hypothetical protein